MRIGHRQFKPSLAGTVATFVLIPVLIGLGLWQLRRADEKQALIDRLQAGGNTTQLFNAGNAETLPLLQQVAASGRYDSAHQILLDNMWSSRRTERNGEIIGTQPGVNVLTPFHLDDGSIVLVNRGWAPFGRTRADLPTVDVGDDSRSMRARVSSIPEPGMRLSNNDAGVNWPRLLNYPTVAELHALYGERLLPRILLLDAAEPDGFQRDWSARYDFKEFGPDRHIAYAVQWFGMAFGLLVIYFVVSLKPLQTDAT